MYAETAQLCANCNDICYFFGTNKSLATTRPSSRSTSSDNDPRLKGLRNDNFTEAVISAKE
eukprot:scaffold4481_cov121-Cylindrotheca_fusiformis.AAC.4